MRYAAVGPYVVKWDSGNGELQALHDDGSIFVGRIRELDLGPKAHIRITRDSEKQSQLTMTVSQKEGSMLLRPVSVPLKPSIQTSANAFAWLQGVVKELSAQFNEMEDLRICCSRQKTFIEQTTSKADMERRDILKRFAKVLYDGDE